MKTPYKLRAKIKATNAVVTIIDRDNYDNEAPCYFVCIDENGAFDWFKADQLVALEGLPDAAVQSSLRTMLLDCEDLLAGDRGAKFQQQMTQLADVLRNLGHVLRTKTEGC